MYMLQKTVEILQQSQRVTVFTGAGISVESGIPPFRGPDGLWQKVDPVIFDIHFFRQHPLKTWEILSAGFLDQLDQAQPNAAHLALAQMENTGMITTVITQNIDGMHQRAGSQQVLEFHGNVQLAVCLSCGRRAARRDLSLTSLPPRCPECGGIFKPDCVFFGEPIPEPAQSRSFQEAFQSDCFLLIGTSGEIMPACMIPTLAKQQGAKIIEINLEPSLYTHSITDCFLPGRATEQMERLLSAVQAG
ncbi:NAD-dependent deacylase [candidate division FCPU426 bacterium]|nr:NAD-dependent deacylase [candidate division FCPU426 bacterium]